MTVAAAGPAQLEYWLKSGIKTEPGIIPSGSGASKSDRSPTCFKHVFSPAGVMVTAEKPSETIRDRVCENLLAPSRANKGVFLSYEHEMCLRTQHIKPEGENRDRVQIPPLGQATILIPMVSGNHHLITALSHSPQATRNALTATRTSHLSGLQTKHHTICLTQRMDKKYFISQSCGSKNLILKHLVSNMDGP